MAKKIKIIKKCINIKSLRLESQVQIVEGQAFYLFARCADQATHINVLIINN